MEREEWTPLIGIQDIFAYLGRRAGWGAAVWSLALLFMFQAGDLPRDARTVYMLSFAGSLAASLVLTWRQTERHQWTGALPYLLTTLLVMALLVPMALVAHWVWGFSSHHDLWWILGMSTLGVLLRGVSSTAWMKPYWRGH